MKKFILNLVKFFSLPVLLISLLIYFYVKRDVYMDFGKYDNYSWKYGFQQLGDLSTKKLLNSSIKYNSFVFGSSRSIGVYACYLQKKIANSRFFHYANWAETIGGIYAKLNLADSLGYDLDNILIYIDTDFTFAYNGQCLYNDHYLLTKDNKFKYYYSHFKSFLSSDDMLRIIFGYKIDKGMFPDWKSDISTNDPRHICSDGILNEYGIKKAGMEFDNRIEDQKKTGILYKRDMKLKFKEKQISPDIENILIKIKDIFIKHNSKYYIVITPLYDQLKFDPSDIQIIVNIFGSNVYDFSGVNNITNDDHNYPDAIHFQDYISKQIIDSVVVNHQ